MAERSFVASEDVLARAVGDEVVLLQLSTEKYFGLRGSAAAMWTALLDHGTIGAAHAEVVGQFEASDELLRTDLERFADDLVERGLLQG